MPASFSLVSSPWLSRLSASLLASVLLARAAEPPAPTREELGTTTKLESVPVEDKPWLRNRETRYAHSLAELDGATLTVTKKTSVEKLDAFPTIADNNQRELFARLPGVLVAENQDPTELNLGYRGLGNPQESEFVLVLQDGLPLASDWIGFPTLYSIPVPQTIAAIQMIRGGSGLLYGPEPQPVLNYLSRPPQTGQALGLFTEQVGGSNGLFASFNRLEGTQGAWNYLADYTHRETSGPRANGASTLDAGDAHVGFKLSPTQTLALDFHHNATDAGIAGFLTLAQFQANPNQSTTPIDHRWVRRHTFVLTYENVVAGASTLTAKLWAGQQSLTNRSGTYTGSTFVPSTGANATTLDALRFFYLGADARLLQRWGGRNATTVGFTAYDSRSPWRRWTGPNPTVGRDDHTGTQIYDNDRSTRYRALFTETVIRFAKFHIVPSARLEHESLGIAEHLLPVTTTRAKVNSTYNRSVPLLGLGLGNDFGQGNETYVNIAQGFRPLRYLDLASPTSKFDPANQPNPTKYTTYELGVHGWPRSGLFYDVSLFQVDAKNRLETVANSSNPNDQFAVNTGSTRSRGVEAELSYDLLRAFGAKAAKDHLEAFVSASVLDAKFTASALAGQTGKQPADAPHSVLKGGLTYLVADQLKLSVTAQQVATSYWRDANTGTTGVPALIPSYGIVDLAGEYTFAHRWRVLGGISNLADRHYYSRVFPFGTGGIEPAKGRTSFLGVSVEF